MAAHSLPRPPTRGHANSNQRGHNPRVHARLVNLDTGHHVDAHGVEHKTSEGNPAHVGPHTIILAMNMGHDAMKAGDHMRMDTSAAKHLRGKATMPHPNEIARRLGKAIMREGSPGEEAAETPAKERAEVRAGTEKPTKKRLPLPARKAA